MVELTLLHWIYVGFVVLIIGFMLRRLDTSLICIGGIFTIAFIATGNAVASVSSIFTRFIYAIPALLPTILII